jgi:hypothetical protein
MASLAFGIKIRRRKIRRRPMRVVAVNAGQLAAAGDVTATLQHACAVAGDADGFGLSGNQEVVPMIEQPLSRLKIER